MAAEYLYMDFLLGYKEYFGIAGACTEEEVTEIEGKLGVKFPRSYREVYLILGKHRGFRFIDDNSYKFPQYEEMRAGAEEIMSQCDIDFVLDKNMFIVGCFMENGIFYFFKLNEGDDPPVYRYEEGDREYKLTAESCSSFIQQRNWYSGYLYLKKGEDKKSEKG
ncbi:SMI1/KNR4 family protein [Chitinophaga filiformis]|uniref:SMI1 / KNR4 family (SUKH-1) n=1 Tax=Chitinophaga filiformis TaxID=104663 RepID=A0A1G8AKV9_CHIFI|nr:SMI1/KNR4 family protein [Chitinophaga filiformis]SDH20950.1 SMI1 / KNR4 family (SUKH-1) [Chitinophaga filiformis]